MTEDLIIKFMLEETTPEENRVVEEWLSANPANRKYFEQFRSVWNAGKELAIKSTSDETAAWNRFRSKIHANADLNTAVPKQQVKLRMFSWMRIAALFIVIGGAALISYIVLNRNQHPGYENKIALEKILRDTLSDGSVVTLNKNSKLVYPRKFKSNERKVALDGEAFFNITPDKNKPFVIQVNDVMVKVIGTSFNIRSINGITEVIVETGIVEVSQKNRKVLLHPREKVLISNRDTTLEKMPEADALYNYYRTNEFVCDNTPLWKLAEVLNEAYGVQIVIGRNELRNLPLTTTFSNESLDRILEVISITFNTKISRAGNRIIIQ